ncbi:MAG: hypothetical protein NW226_18490 [Microscillaceae bacterium]|nr:hypothetical protein [Microscillaceae bacterium]
MKNYYLIIFLLFAEIFCTQAQLRRNTIVDFQLEYDSTNQINFFKHKIDIGLVARTHHGKTIRTVGLLGEWMHWNVKVNPGQFQEGLITFNSEDLYTHNHQIRVKASPKNNPTLQKEYIIKIPYLESFILTYDTLKSFSPGYWIHIHLWGNYSNGQNHNINRTYRGKLIEDFSVDVLPASQFSGDSVLIPVVKSEEEIYDSVYISVLHNLNSTIQTQIAIPVDYAGEYTMDFNGINGQSNGRGVKGQDGYHGPRVNVYVKSFRYGSKEFLKIKAVSADKKDSLIINKLGGKVLIRANGGNGGNGGKGISGRIGDNYSGNGYGGDGGAGGNGGNGGNGGQIIVYTDINDYDFLFDRINIENVGGKEGIGGGGGSKGVGDYDGNIAASIIGGKGGRRGSRGANGIPGIAGPPLEIKIISTKELNRAFEE